jgi:hypothetical protein
MQTAMGFLCAVYRQSLVGVDWADKDDVRFHLRYTVGESIAQREPATPFELSVYREVLEDNEDDEEGVSFMEAVITATEAKFVARERQERVDELTRERERQVQIARTMARYEQYQRDHPEQFKTQRPLGRQIYVFVPTSMRGVAYVLNKWLKKRMTPQAARAAA